MIFHIHLNIYSVLLVRFVLSWDLAPDSNLYLTSEEIHRPNLFASDLAVYYLEAVELLVLPSPQKHFWSYQLQFHLLLNPFRLFHCHICYWRSNSMSHQFQAIDWKLVDVLVAMAQHPDPVSL